MDPFLKKYRNEMVEILQFFNVGCASAKLGGIEPLDGPGFIHATYI